MGFKDAYAQPEELKDESVWCIAALLICIILIEMGVKNFFSATTTVSFSIMKVMKSDLNSIKDSKWNRYKIE